MLKYLKKVLLMIKTIEAYDIADPKFSDSIDIEFPHQCPLCQNGIDAKLLSAFYIGAINCHHLFILYFCPVCEMCFVGFYVMRSSNYGNSSANLVNFFPYSEEKTAFSSKISSLSPNFVNIYNQAEKAEHIGLNDICGLGYRKALEFLVKDYAIAFNPDNESDIKKQMLSPCINSYIDNRRIKSLATASAWIGNDETHYLRKHEDYNIGHLKAFISAIVSYIDAELSYLEAESLLSKSK